MSKPQPRIDPTAYVHPQACIMGDVRLAAHVSVWPFTSLRGDVETIEIGENSNVQDLCVMHGHPGFPVRIGRNVTVGHMAIVHGAVVEDDSLIGIRAVVLNGAKIGRGSLVAAGAVVTPGTVVPPNSLVMGLPGKVVKTDPGLPASNRAYTKSYLDLLELHKRGDFPPYGPSG